VHRKIVIGLMVLLTACSGAAVVTTTTSTVTTSTAQTTSTTQAPTADATVAVLFAPYSEMGPTWSELFFPYGEGEESLGTSPGGDGGSVNWGPDYGTQTPDGTWWFLDAARLRIAHFDGDGVYLDQFVVPAELLVDGVYFQYQMPQALDDGSLAVGGFDRPLLRMVEGAMVGLDVDGNIPWSTTDGTYLFGASPEDGSLLRLDPANPVIEPVDWLTTRSGSRFRVTVIEDEVLVELPDLGLTRTLQMRYSEDPQVAARAGIEFESGVDGSLHVLFNGAPVTDETIGIGGIVTIGPNGDVGSAEAIADPFSPSDPGSPARLGVTPGTSTPWMMLIGEDGVRVFTRDG
jgi:hypothetical protein